MLTLRWGRLQRVKVHQGFDTKGVPTQNTGYRGKRMSRTKILEARVFTEQRICQQPEGRSLLPQTQA